MQKHVQQLKEQALNAEIIAENKGFHDEVVNQVAVTAITEWRAANKTFLAAQEAVSASGFNLLPNLLLLGGLLTVLFTVAAKFMRLAVPKFVVGFIGVYFLTLCAHLLGAQSMIKSWGIGYEAWAIIIGLLISNTVGTPWWMKSGIQAELFIKTGLVLLGAEILLVKIMVIGLPGLLVTWLVTPVVLITTYWFGQKILKISSKTLNMTISADFICLWCFCCYCYSKCLQCKKR